MTRKSFSPRDRERRKAAAPAPAPIPVSDHALVRYLDRVLDIDMELIRREIGLACARHQGAPCVKIGGARFIIREATVVTTLPSGGPVHLDWLSTRRSEEGDAA